MALKRKHVTKQAHEHCKHEQILKEGSYMLNPMGNSPAAKFTKCLTTRSCPTGTAYNSTPPGLARHQTDNPNAR